VLPLRWGELEENLELRLEIHELRRPPPSFFRFFTGPLVSSLLADLGARVLPTWF
jgi:hypothetical protein